MLNVHMLNTKSQIIWAFKNIEMLNAESLHMN